MSDYYTALITLQKLLAGAYHIKNTSTVPAEVQRAIETIEYIEGEIVKLEVEVSKEFNEGKTDNDS